MYSSVDQDKIKNASYISYQRFYNRFHITLTVHLYELGDSYVRSHGSQVTDCYCLSVLDIFKEMARQLKALFVVVFVPPTEAQRWHNLKLKTKQEKQKFNISLVCRSAHCQHWFWQCGWNQTTPGAKSRIGHSTHDAIIHAEGSHVGRAGRCGLKIMLRYLRVLKPPQKHLMNAQTGWQIQISKIFWPNTLISIATIL